MGAISDFLRGNDRVSLSYCDENIRCHSTCDGAVQGLAGG